MKLSRYFPLGKINTFLFLIAAIFLCLWVFPDPNLAQTIGVIVAIIIGALTFAVPQIRQEFLTSRFAPFILIPLLILFYALWRNGVPMADVKAFFLPPDKSELTYSNLLNVALTEQWATALAHPTATPTPTPNLTATTSFELTRQWALVSQTPTVIIEAAPTLDATRTFEAQLTQAWLDSAPSLTANPPTVEITQTFEAALTQAWMAKTPDATTIFASALTRAWEMQLTATRPPA